MLWGVIRQGQGWGCAFKQVAWRPGEGASLMSSGRGYIFIFSCCSNKLSQNNANSLSHDFCGLEARVGLAVPLLWVSQS